MGKNTIGWCETHKLYFKKAEEMDNHLMRFHYDLHCNKCARNFKNHISMRLHMQTAHRNDNTGAT